MKKSKLLVSALIVSACLAAGVMFGCSSSGSTNGQSSDISLENLTEYEKILAVNTIENLAGTDGTLSCTIEQYGEEEEPEDSLSIVWKTSGGKTSLKYVDTLEDGTIYAASEYSGDNCGALYSVEDDMFDVWIYPQNNFTSDLSDEWLNFIDYDGTEGEVVVNDNVATLKLTYEPDEDEDSYYTVDYTFDPDTYILSNVEVTDIAVEGDEVLATMIIKDISTENTDLTLEQDPYQLISAGVSDEDACNLTVVVNEEGSDQITSTYKVSHDAYVDLMVADAYSMYSDAEMTTLIDEIDVSDTDATVYIQIEEDSGESTLDVSEDEAGDEYVADDGSVITLGEDGNFYDEDGNVVEFDDSE